MSFVQNGHAVHQLLAEWNLLWEWLAPQQKTQISWPITYVQWIWFLTWTLSPGGSPPGPGPGASAPAWRGSASAAAGSWETLAGRAPGDLPCPRAGAPGGVTRPARAPGAPSQQPGGGVSVGCLDSPHSALVNQNIGCGEYWVERVKLGKATQIAFRMFFSYTWYKTDTVRTVENTVIYILANTAQP